MGFWPFGREPADVNSASRIVTAPTRDSVRVRAKLTVHFRELQTQSAADEAAEHCAGLAEQLFREADGLDHLLGHEDAIAATLAQRMPPVLPPIRLVEVAALHVIGAPSTFPLSRRRPTDRPTPEGTPLPPPSVPYPSATGFSPRVPADPASAPPSAPLSAGPYGTGNVRAPPSTPYPPSSVRAPPSSVGFRRRTASSSIRAITASLVPPVGSTASAIGASLAPLIRDSATRLLIGFLRVHDLLRVRRVVLDEGATELLTALLPVSEAPAGEFEASRATELARWRDALGPEVLDALRRESQALIAFQAQVALRRVGVVPATALEMLEALCEAAFPGALRAATAADIARYTEDGDIAEAARSVGCVLAHPDAGPLEIALAPLIEATLLDMEVMARLAKVSLGLPA